jgi:chemotaxis protein methyltransferase CheR
LVYWLGKLRFFRYCWGWAFQAMATRFDLRHVCFEGTPAAVVRRKAGHDACKSGGHSHVPPLSVEPADGFLGWVIGRAGLDASLYRHQPLLRRLPACLRTLKVHSEEDARELLEDRPDLLPAAVGSLLIGVTEFFRDPAVFESVQAKVLPNLADRRTPLRVWSAGCSTGEELYSLAILLAEAGLLAGSFLLGSDCRAEAIEQARSALYGAAANPLQPAIRRKYFKPAGTSWRVRRPLRRQVRWEVADLGEEIAQGPWDIILWRNLAIYLTPGRVETLWNRLTGALAPGGFLIVGKAERPPSGLGLAPVCRCVYRKSGPTVARRLPEKNLL